MGYDPNAGSFQPLEPEQIAEFLRKTPGGIIFTEGETVEVKGAKFTVSEVGHSRLVLKSIKK